MKKEEISAVKVFTEYEKDKIVDEFEYYNQKKETDNKIEDPFMEQML